MNKYLSIKIASIVFVALLIVIPLFLIEEKIGERANLRDTAGAAIAASWTGEQSVSGPIVAIRYSERVAQKRAGKSGFRYDSLEDVQTKQKEFTPQSLNITAQMRTEILRKGIYPIPVYTSQLHFQGTINTKEIVQAIKELEQNESVVKIEAATLLWRVNDPRGLNKISNLVLGSETYQLKPGAPHSLTGSGMHLPLPNELLKKSESLAFDLNLELRGMRELSFVPQGKQTNIELTSDWPHPSFTGAFLPASRDITDEGFKASWHVNEFASSAVQNSSACGEFPCENRHSLLLGVALVDPVDVYLQSERAVKYGFLFVVLIFTSFLTFELLAQLKIHPVQYSLVGAAVATFFLLLISLAEHLGFRTAYALSASASLGVIGIYLRSILQSSGRAAAFCLGLGILYWLLYLIIQSEDFALLMGALLCFMVLCAVMLLTRNINWYLLGGTTGPDKNGKSTL